ncbi:MAG: hypothetical protein AMXMBFR13_14300 [Phycisphaerae bacterium]
MYAIVATIAILVTGGLVHAKYGLGCWGLQPGGRWMANLFWLQTAVSLAALAHSAVIVLRQRTWVGASFTLFALVLAAAAVWQYWRRGWRMDTSIHNQGPENLPTFLLASSVAVVCGVYMMRGK